MESLRVSLLGSCRVNTDRDTAADAAGRRRPASCVAVSELSRARIDSALRGLEGEVGECLHVRLRDGTWGGGRAARDSSLELVKAVLVDRAAAVVGDARKPCVAIGHCLMYLNRYKAIAATKESQRDPGRTTRVTRAP